MTQDHSRWFWEVTHTLPITTFHMTKMVSYLQDQTATTPKAAWPVSQLNLQQSSWQNHQRFRMSEHPYIQIWCHICRWPKNQNRFCMSLTGWPTITSINSMAREKRETFAYVKKGRDFVRADLVPGFEGNTVNQRGTAKMTFFPFWVIFSTGQTWPFGHPWRLNRLQLRFHCTAQVSCSSSTLTQGMFSSNNV